MARTMDEKTELLSRAVTSEAHDEAEKLLADARAKADGLLKRAREEADEERKDILARAKEDADRIRGQAIATAQLKARTMELEQREKLLRQVFDLARQQLAGAQQRTDYPQIAAALLREALQNLDARQAVVHLDEASQRELDPQAISTLAGQLELEAKVGDPLPKGIGVTAESADGHLHYDNTLETRLNRMQNSLRAPVYRLLMGERL